MSSLDRQAAAARAGQAKLNEAEKRFRENLAVRRELQAIEDLHATVPGLLELLTKVGMPDAEKLSVKGRFGIPRRQPGWKLYGNLGKHTYLLHNGMICQITWVSIVTYPIGHEAISHVHALDGVHKLLVKYSQ